eukprot:11005804-Karenia_brevis.AAC.1
MVTRRPTKRATVAMHPNDGGLWGPVPIRTTTINVNIHRAKRITTEMRDAAMMRDDNESKMNTTLGKAMHGEGRYFFEYGASAADAKVLAADPNAA